MELNRTQRIPNKVDDDVINQIEIKEANESQWKKVSNKNKKRKHSFVNNKPEISKVEEEYNCDEECDFQGTSQDQLEKHIKIKHRITCRICDECYKSKSELMVHRKEKHPNFVRMCRNYNEGKCPFADSKCWWNHKQIQSSPQEVKCFVCEEK